MDTLRFCVAVLLGCAGYGLLAAATLILAHQLAVVVVTFARRVLSLRNHTEGL